MKNALYRLIVAVSLITLGSHSRGAAPDFLTLCTSPDLSEGQKATLTEIFRQQGMKADFSSANCQSVLQEIQKRKSLSLSQPVSDLSPLATLDFLEDLSVVRPTTSDFSVLATLTHLRELYLFNNAERPLSIDLSPLAALKNLRTLQVWSLGVRDLSPLAGLVGLTELSLEFNQITDLRPLAGLTSLQTLDVSENKLASLAGVERLSALTELSASSDAIDDFGPLASVAHLQRLSIGAGPFQERGCDISALAGKLTLQHLDLYCSPQDPQALQTLTGLVELSLDATGLRQLEFVEKLTALQSLGFGGGQIADLHSLAGLAHLRYLQAVDNGIHRLNGLENLKALESLDLRGNELEDLGPLATVTNLGSLFAGSYLGKGHNTYRSLEPLHQLSRLYDLDVTDSPVADVSPLAGQINLRRLFLKGTQVTDTSALAPLVEQHQDSRGDWIALFIDFQD